MTNSKLKLVTHNGSFHADDLFACATLSLYLKKAGKDFEIIRSRDIDTINSADYVFDVGGVYDKDLNRFDHHQKNGAGQRENGILYASFGLVWKHFGLELCGGSEVVWGIIDKEIASPIDANDNGQDLVEPKYPEIFPYAGTRPFLVFSPTWKESDAQIDEIFRNEVENVVRILKREIEVAKTIEEGKNILYKAYENSADKRLVEIPAGFPRYLYQGTLSALKDIIYVVYPSNYGESWKIEAIQKNPMTMQSRKPFPQKWRGYTDDDPRLSEVTGIKDAIFCHQGGFLAGTKSKESALELARISLEKKEEKKFNLFKWLS